tara:strand:- start:1823 stop:1972 length:150 start_codon:yes stop_codon:yes gene_type:complete
MLYQLSIILIIIVAALLISKRLKGAKDNHLIYEDDMDEDELKKIDEEIN